MKPKSGEPKWEDQIDNTYACKLETKRLPSTLQSTIIQDLVTCSCQNLRQKGYPAVKGRKQSGQKASPFISTRKCTKVAAAGSDTVVAGSLAVTVSVFPGSTIVATLPIGVPNLGTDASLVGVGFLKLLLFFLYLLLSNKITNYAVLPQYKWCNKCAIEANIAVHNCDVSGGCGSFANPMFYKLLPRIQLTVTKSDHKGGILYSSLLHVFTCDVVL